jgi:hypothetical protein
VVSSRRITCADAWAKLARDGWRRRSLLHGCYTIDLDVGTGRSINRWLPETGTQSRQFQDQPSRSLKRPSAQSR